ncbi:Gfo/Idh/MocA family protein [Paenibacillus mucilaginosus]|uniref:Oxidoreductase n=1 Tax=Paenibacillus mucilaginosus (strain KNP414) TaxID=1036673 RepID=F8FAM8_PAEMK|nr:Gfo/Idh/MocA family oxidoreductase [Paenibacillus mucilaginosus]AEI41117.1 oxidoreductase [Paenibacillus mucilaginosus KNP414]MCG7211448.1 Gfo/Idh/MocA family oxidoreductase [Paenibacillus mucilaginosus]WDM30175.1 Gfo/Idh/MocA family oxidoreductase [Paenibacillus mucilaginosus]
MNKEIRWGIIGCGNVTEVKSGPALQQADGSRLTAVMRRDGRLAEDYARRHGIPKWYDQAEDLIADEEVDAVYIATPPAFHKSYAIEACRAGKPVYVEKPMALNAAECEEMTAASERSGVPIYVAYYRRALPRFVQVKQWLDAGAIGEVLAVNTMHVARPKPDEVNGTSASWRTRPELSGGGYFFDLASHTLDLLDYLLGPIGAASGFSSNLGGYYEAEDTVTGAYRFESGAHGTGTWCFAADRNLEYNEITGTRGRIEFSTFTEAPVRLLRDGSVEELLIPNPAHVQQPLIQHIVDELLGRGSSPSTAATAIRTSRVMDALVR